jgi:hypothetical protein
VALPGSFARELQPASPSHHRTMLKKQNRIGNLPADALLHELLLKRARLFIARQSGKGTKLDSQT